MPVVVTGASGGIGRVLVPLLAQRGEVRAVVRDRAASEPLRAAGAKVAVADLADTVLMATVMAGAHTVVHLAGGVDLPDDRAYEAANLGTTLDAVDAAKEAGVSRFLFLSYPGASAGSANSYLRAKGLAEEAVGASDLHHLILRSTHVYGPGQRWLDTMRKLAGRLVATVIGTGRQRVAPVHVNDVAAALVAADDRVEPMAGTFAVQGPEELTADEVIDLAGGRRRRKSHVAADSVRRAARAFGRPVHPALLEILAEDSLADAPSLQGELGLTLTSLKDGLTGQALNGS